MIVCVSANPGLDRRVRVNTFALGQVNRVTKVEVLPGGKAAHVAMAARALGARTAWIAFLGGAIGEQCAIELRQLDIEVVVIPTRAPTRVNLEVIDDSGQVTELLEPGGTPDTREQQEMLQVCVTKLNESWKQALVVISGSLPAGVPADFYSRIITSAHSAGSQVFLDTSGDALAANLAAQPDFVKPNRPEAEALLGRPVESSHAAQQAAAELIARGARSAAITLGAEGLIWMESSQGPCWIASPPRLTPSSAVGCGDVTLAGFAYASQQGWQGEHAVRFATACGAANCLARREGRIDVKDVEALLPQIKITRV